MPRSLAARFRKCATFVAVAAVFAPAWSAAQEAGEQQPLIHPVALRASEDTAAVPRAEEAERLRDLLAQVPDDVLTGDRAVDPNENLRKDAVHAAVADAATTAIALLAGAAEANPLGPVLATGLKPAALWYIKRLPNEEQPTALAVAASVWSGAAANNLCVTAAILSGGSFAPLCAALGIAYGVAKWHSTAEERAFWKDGCAKIREITGLPDVKCVYAPATGNRWPRLPLPQGCPLAGAASSPLAQPPAP